MIWNEINCFAVQSKKCIVEVLLFFDLSYSPPQYSDTFLLLSPPSSSSHQWLSGSAAFGIAPVTPGTKVCRSRHGPPWAHSALSDLYICSEFTACEILSVNSRTMENREPGWWELKEQWTCPLGHGFVHCTYIQWCAFHTMCLKMCVCMCV